MKNKSAFTLIELVVVMGIIFILFGLTAFSIVGIQQKTSLNTTIDTLLTDLKSQQLKAMIGDTEGRTSGSAYGIYFETNDYVLFHGLTYVPASPDNFTVKSGDNVRVTDTFTNHQIVFSQTAGEIVNFTDGSNTVTFTNTVSSESKTVTINRYGVVTNVN